MRIVLAPMHGFTDVVYRKAHAAVYGGIDEYMAPFIRTGNGLKVNKNRLKDVVPEKNVGLKITPQILSNNESQFLVLANELFDLGYDEVNLNMGCPYPMVTKKGAGAGMLQDLPRTEAFLSSILKEMPNRLSVKVRIGFQASDELPKIIELLNRFDVCEVTVHPRTAVQMYKGKVDPAAFEICQNDLKHSLMYNGDILSIDDFKRFQSRFETIDQWMLGRGILIDPALPLKIKQKTLPENEKKSFFQFHNLIVNGYGEVISSDHHVVDKLKSHWEYWHHLFCDIETYKRIKRSKKLATYQSVIADI